jgi:hypothetical protein
MNPKLFFGIIVIQIQKSVNKLKLLTVCERCKSLTFISREPALIGEDSKFHETCHLATCNPYIRPGPDSQVVQPAPSTVGTLKDH